MGRNREIGRNNDLPWPRMRADMDRFRSLTMSHAVIMGRRTWESLPKPLVKRTNIVVSRSLQSVAEPAICARSVHEAVLEAIQRDAQNIFIIGGAEIYRNAMEFTVQRLYVTVIDACFPDADTYYPEIPEAEWRLVQRSAFSQDEKNPFPYAFLEFERRRENA